MALQGAPLATYFGWLWGMIFLQKPWGQPNFSSFFSLSLVIHLAITAMWLFLSIDCLINFRAEVIHHFAVSYSETLSLLVQVKFLENCITSVLIRMVFLYQAKTIGRLWKHLYIRNQKDAKSFQFYKTNIVNIIIGMIPFLLNLTLAVTDALPISRNFHKSWISNVGRIPYSVILGIFLIGPFVLAPACGYAVLLTTIHHLVWIYKGYCKKLLNLIEKSAIGVRCIMSAKLKMYLIEDFESIQCMFSMFDSGLSPILLILLCGGTLRLVACCSKLVLMNRTEDVTFRKIELAKDITTIVICCCWLMVLEAGQAVIRRVRLFTFYKVRVKIFCPF